MFSALLAVFAVVPFTAGKLHTLATKKAGKLYFGTAVDNPGLTDAPYVAIVNDTSEFGQLTPANGMKWGLTEPEQGVFTFEDGDAVADLATANGQILRGHACVWHNQLPGWVVNGTFDNSTLLEAVRSHCSAVVSHYAGRIYSWDVVNEAVDDDGSLRATLFYNTTGTAYIAEAFHAAREADPNTKLYINDYNLEYAGPKQDAEYELIKSLLAAGVPIDGVGLQAHFVVGQIPLYHDLVSSLQRFADLGLEVAYTEIDIRMNLPVRQDVLETQRRDYETVVRACLAVDACVGLTVWDYTDRYSWVPETFAGQGAPCPWDEDLEKKPAYYGIAKGLSRKGGHGH